MAGCAAGDWVEVSRVILEPGGRAPNLPADTAGVPYALRVRGVALSEAEIGGALRVRTQAGRELEGRLEAVSPAFRHDFGECVPELIELRRRLVELARGGASGEEPE
jgi:hypothetical protein